jgi:hypothetical protein
VCRGDQGDGGDVGDIAGSGTCAATAFLSRLSLFDSLRVACAAARRPGIPRVARLDARWGCRYVRSWTRDMDHRRALRSASFVVPSTAEDEEYEKHARTLTTAAPISNIPLISLPSVAQRRGRRVSPGGFIRGFTRRLHQEASPEGITPRSHPAGSAGKPLTRASVSPRSAA